MQRYYNRSFKPPVGAYPNMGHPILNECVLWLPFNDQGGKTVHDIGPGRKHGSIDHANTTWVNGHLGRTVDMTGAGGELITFNNLWGTYGGPMTWSMWLNISSAANMGTGTATSGFERFVILPWSDNNIYWDYGDWTWVGRISTSYSSYFGKWTHVVVTSFGTRDAGKAIWLDGVKVNSSSRSDGPAGAQTWRIGEGAGSTLNASIDDVRLWKRVLSDREIQSLYWDPYAPFRNERAIFDTAAAAADVSAMMFGSVF